MSLRGLFRRIKRRLVLDPVSKCILHKKIGCGHVDGMLCGFPNCEMRREFAKTGTTRWIRKD